MSSTLTGEETLAAAVAMLGEWARPEILAAACEIPETEARAELARLKDSGTLAPGMPAALADDALRAAAIAAIPAASAALMRQRIAEQLHAHGALPEEIAEHLLQAPGQEREANVRALAEAARAHRRTGALQAAAACLQRALREPPHARELPSLLIELAETHLEGGRHEQALHCASRALELAEDPATRVGAAAVRFQAQLGCAAIERALAEIQAEIEIADRADQSLALRLERELVAAGQTNARILGVALARYERRRIDESLPAAGSYLTAVGLVLAAGGRSSAAGALQAVRRALPRQRGETLPLEVALRAAWLLMIAEEAEEAAAVLEAARGGAGAGSSLPLLDAIDGALALRGGAVAAARGGLQAALAAAQRRHDPIAIGLSTALLGHALLEADERRRLHDLLAGYVQGERTKGMIAGLMRLLRARLELDAQRPAQALEELRVIERRKLELGLTNPAVLPHAEPAVHALLELGQRGPALQMAQVNLQRAQAWGAPGTVARAQGALAACMAPRERLPILAEAIAMLQRSPARLDRLRLQLALGLAESACGRGRAARQTLTGVRREASAAGAARIDRRAREELARLLHTGTAAALTAGEQRIAALAAAGLPNRRIAERLHLSVRTVENALHRVYAKLGCDRAGLVEHLAM